MYIYIYIYRERERERERREAPLEFLYKPHLFQLFAAASVFLCLFVMCVLIVCCLCMLLFVVTRNNATHECRLGASRGKRG